MPVQLCSAPLKYKDTNGNYQDIVGIKGEDYVLTNEDKAEIAENAPVQDVQIDGTSILSNGVANVPLASSTKPGVMKYSNSSPIVLDGNGSLTLRFGSNDQIRAGTTVVMPFSIAQQHIATFYGLAKVAGDTTQSESNNTVGTYTEAAKSAIKSMLGIVDGSTSTVDITGATPTITAVENTRYVCGEVTSLTLTPPASGICIIRFTSGSTPTVLTLPSTVKFPEWFDYTTLETNTIYEMCITDGIYGAVMTWAL